MSDEEPDVKEALELAQFILDHADDLPRQASEFAESVREKAESMKAWIQAHNRVTHMQYQALENMQAWKSGWKGDKSEQARTKDE